jgi:hypothetical protein
MNCVIECGFHKHTVVIMTTKSIVSSISLQGLKLIFWNKIYL